jgi:DNA-directed RNA polymerase specialized sigma24 family protein
MVREFVSTSWGLIARAGNANAPDARKALNDLCQLYWYPVYAFIRRRSHSSPDSEDLTQGFFVHLLEKNLLAEADCGKGRFRSFLLTCCMNYLSKERERTQTRKRGGHKKIVSFHRREAEQRFRLEPTTNLTPEVLFEKQWALTSLDSVMRHLEHECTANGKKALFEQLRPVLVCDHDAEAYAGIGPALGMTELALKKAAQRIRDRFRDLLREQIAATVDAPESIDDEIRTLFQALAH